MAFSHPQKLEGRHEAGEKLVEKLEAFKEKKDLLVLALPRGGVEVAYEIASALNAPLDVFLVRKLGVPGHPELAMGAIASGGERHLNESIVSQLKISVREIENVIQSEEKELKRRESLYRMNRPPVKIYGRTVLLVDDGLATGATMLVALQALRKKLPHKIIVVVPVLASSSLPEIEKQADEVIYLSAPENFESVGQWYVRFPQVSDKEVKDLLAGATNS